MKNFNLSLLGATCLASSLSVFSATPSGTPDVLGEFAENGVIGIYAGTETVTDAHRICIATIPSAEGSTRSFDGDSYDSYKTCMAQYVPFKVSGSDEAGACGSETVRWGQCASTLPSQPDGSPFSAKNTFDTDNYEGFASFQCSGAKWSFVGGGCSRAVNKCEDKGIVKWDVTSPAWADNTRGTPFTDRFGVDRHTPKGSCYASMPEALSGTLMDAKPTNPETQLTVGGAPGNIRSSSTQPARCFDSEWLIEGDRAANCDYIPQTCKAKSYINTGGCKFSLPSGAHDSVYSVNKPVGPQNSVGGIQAHCWDGEWEVKSTSCALSCEPVVPEKTWDSGVTGVTKLCHHNDRDYTDRLSPGHNLLIDNNTIGMIGSASYTCDNGTLVNNSESCAPKGCEGLPAKTWVSGSSVCSHPTITGSYQHGKKIWQNVGDLFSDTTGKISYICEYGEFKVVGTPSCDDADVKVNFCDATGGTSCPEDGMIFDNGICCFTSGSSSTCTTEDPVIGTTPTPIVNLGFECDKGGCTSMESRTSGYGKGTVHASLTFYPTINGEKPASWAWGDCPTCTWSAPDSVEANCRIDSTTSAATVTDAQYTNNGGTGGVTFKLSVSEGNLDSGLVGTCDISFPFTITKGDGSTHRVNATGKIIAETK